MMHRAEMPLAVIWEIKNFSPNITFPTIKPWVVYLFPLENAVGLVLCMNSLY